MRLAYLQFEGVGRDGANTGIFRREKTSSQHVQVAVVTGVDGVVRKLVGNQAKLELGGKSSGVLPSLCNLNSDYSHVVSSPTSNTNQHGNKFPTVKCGK